MKNENMKEIENYFEKMEQYQITCDAAKEAGDESTIIDCRAGVMKLWKKIDENKNRYKMYSLYGKMKRQNNEYINLSESNEYNDVDGLLNCLKEYGIKIFSFSSVWKDALKGALKIQQAGCTLEGMIEVNAPTKYMSKDYEKVPALLFKIN